MYHLIPNKAFPSLHLKEVQNLAIPSVNIRKGQQEIEMAKADQTLQEIKEEVRELRVLYKELVDRLIPVDKPTAAEKRAIRERDDVATESELMGALGVRHRD